MRCRVRRSRSCCSTPAQRSFPAMSGAFHRVWRRVPRLYPHGSRRSLLIDNPPSLASSPPRRSRSHSPFAKALLARFRPRRIAISTICSILRRATSPATCVARRSEILTRAGAPRFCLDPLCGAKDNASEEKPAAVGGPHAAQQAWEGDQRPEGAGDLEIFEAFLRQHPEGVYAALAKSRVAKLKQSTGAAPTPEAPKSPPPNNPPPPETKIALAPPVEPPPAPAVQTEPSVMRLATNVPFWKAVKRSGDASKVAAAPPRSGTTSCTIPIALMSRRRALNMSG